MKATGVGRRNSRLTLRDKWKRDLQKLLSVESSQLFDFSRVGEFCVRKLERYKRQALWMRDGKSKGKHGHQNRKRRK